MPNWCNNKLIVSGKEEEVSKFISEAQAKEDEVISLQKLVPMPQELEGTTSPREKKNKELEKKYGADNWYDWHCLNWGTKWDLYDTEIISRKKRSVQYFFDTAWSPPLTGFVRISRLYPKLKFLLSYDEPGMGFKGEDEIVNGEVKNIRYKTTE